MCVYVSVCVAMQDSVYCETEKRDRETLFVPGCFQGAVVYHHWVLPDLSFAKHRKGGVWNRH